MSPDGRTLLRGCGQRRCRLPGARIPLALGPDSRLAYELAQLGKQQWDAGAFAFESLDPIQPGQHCARFLHVSKVGANW